MNNLIKIKHSSLPAIASVAALLFLFCPLAAQEISGKKTFVLVHGSWHSAWNWFRVTPLLEKMGHRVYAIDLPGMGRDKTPIEQVRFESTVRKIVSLIDTIPGKVILLGHSKNGILISQVAELRPDKIEKLIYLAAFLIPNGKKAQDYFKLDTLEILGPHIVVNENTQSSTLNSAIYKTGLYHDCDNEIVELAKVILTSETLESARATLQLTGSNYGSVPRYYIECTEDRAVSPYLQQKMYNEMPCRKVYKMTTGHSPFFSRPEELVAIMLEIAGL